jgi:mRNA interferase YafQ
MTSKKTASSKRSNLIRRSDYTKEFLKDWQRLTHSGRFDMHRLKEVMLLLIANDEPLPAQWKDHPLRGNMNQYRECHIGGDFLLLYKIDESSQSMIIFTRAGTHADLFE